jgi:hypothetical protein
MDSIKTVTSKLSILLFAFAFAAGCATVTDANADLAPETDNSVITAETNGQTWDNSNRDDMEPIIIKPEMTD